jgi:hypothetical protein
MNISLLSEDMLNEFIRELPLDTLHVFLSTNKKLFKNRFIYIKDNKIIQKFSEYSDGKLYFNVMYNSHIKSYDTVILPITIPTKSGKEEIHNTFDIFSFIISENNMYSNAYITHINKYVCDTLYMNTNLRFGKNDGIIMYCYTIPKEDRAWYECDIYIYDVLEIILYAKHKKFRKVQQCLLNLKIRDTRNVNITFQELLKIFLHGYNKNICTIILYIIYDYISKCDLTKYNNLNKTISYKTDQFVRDIINKITLPIYIKNMIITKMINTKSTLPI